MGDKIFEAKGEIIQTGVFPGLPNQQIPLWKDSNNIVYKDASAKVAGAHEPLFDKGSARAGTGILALDNAGAPALVWGDSEALYKGLTKPTTIDVTRVSGAYTGTDDDLWHFVQFGNTLFATNGVDPVQYMASISDPASKFVDLDTVSDIATVDADFTCKLLSATGAFILALNTHNLDSEYIWCSEDSQLNWVPSAGNSARDIQIRELNSDIVAVVDMGKLRILYGRDQLRVLGFVGSPFYFSDEHLLDGIGAVGKYSVTAVGRKHYGFGSNGLFVMDGSTFSYIDDPSMHKYIYQDNYDKAKQARCVTWADMNEGMVYFSFPTLDGSGLSVAFNDRTGAWATFDWYRTAASTGGLWGHPVMVDASGGIWLQSSSSAAFTTPGNPVALIDFIDYQAGYGIGGYGQGGYGGKWRETR